MSSYVILVGDRDAVQRQLIDLLLAQDGYEIVGVENGQAALEYLRSNTPDLAILDIGLPDVTGADICDKIKSVSRLSHLPVVLTAPVPETNETGIDPRTKALGQLVRADLLLQKPLGDKNLRERVRRLLQPDKSDFRPKRPGLKDTQDIDDTLAALDDFKTNSPKLRELQDEIDMLRLDRATLEKRLSVMQQELGALREQVAKAAGASPKVETTDAKELAELRKVANQQQRLIDRLRKRNALLVEALEKEKQAGEAVRGIFGIGRRRN